MGTLENSEDTDKLDESGSALFAKDKIDLQRKIFLELITYDPSIYTMDHPDFIVSSF